jgi:hypothetical protein
MKTFLLAVLLALGFTAHAQPDDRLVRFTNPCGMPPNDSLDVTGDGIPDLVIGGYTAGTDDEPSSSGSCTRFLGTLPGTTLVCGLDRTGQRVPHAFAFGDTLPSFPNRIQDDLQIPRFVYTEGSIIVLHWGYGHQAGSVLPAPGLEKQVFVFRSISPYEHRMGTFTLEPLPEMLSVRINLGTLVHADEALIVR